MSIQIVCTLLSFSIIHFFIIVNLGYSQDPLPLTTPTLVNLDVRPSCTEPKPDYMDQFFLSDTGESDALSNGWKEIPGGFLGADPGSLSLSIAANSIYFENYSGTRASFLIHTSTAVEIRGYPVLIRMTGMAYENDADLSLLER